MQIHNDGCASACVGSMEHKSKQRSFHCSRLLVRRCHDLNVFSSLLLVFELHFLVLLWLVRVLMSVFCLWGNKASTGNAAGRVFVAIYRHKCVFVLVSLLVAGCSSLGSGRKQQNPGWKFGNGSTGQNISPGCGCLWDSASLVRVYVCVCTQQHSDTPPSPDDI